jgi:hypothetical protein
MNYENMKKENVLWVTKLIDEYKQPFDADLWSSYKALEVFIGPEEYNKIKKTAIQNKKFNTSLLQKYEISLEDFLIKKNEIRASWEQKAQDACERGNMIHSLLSQGPIKINDFVIDTVVNDSKFDGECDGTYCELPLTYTDPITTFQITGIADLVIVKDFEVTIVDYKTNKEIKKGSYYNSALKKRQTMQYPLNTIQDCNFWHYTLQLSFYGWLLEKIDPRLKIKQLIILHFDHKNKQTIYECEYLKDTIDKLLLYHSQKLKTVDKYEKLKPIEY